MNGSGKCKKKSASLGGLEPPTFRLTAERANRLRHRDWDAFPKSRHQFIKNLPSEFTLSCLIPHIKVAWPSGLRRWFKAPVSSEAWVRIPPLPCFFLIFSIEKGAKIGCLPWFVSWRSGQVVRRRSRKPKITGSNPVCAFYKKFICQTHLNFIP